MEQFFLIIRQLLATAGMAWVDRDNNQLNMPGPALPSPAALFTIAINQIDPLTKTSELCKGTISLSVATAMPAMELSAAAPYDAVTRSTEFYRNADTAWKALQGYADDTIEFMDRVSAVDQANKNGYGVVKMIFNCSFLQSSV